MLETTSKILLVDDDPMLLELHRVYLEDQGYMVFTANDGIEALELLQQHPKDIDVVISDITTPNLNGYELCKKIKEQDETHDIPVIFVSALTDLDEKMKGYAVGADDYITKPVHDKELLEKVKALINIRNNQKSLSQQAAQSQDMAMQALTFSSELGQIIEFYKNILEATSYEDISNYVFEVTRAFGLSCSIMIITPSNNQTFGDTDTVSPLEENVMELSRKQARFFDFGNRTIVNYPNFSLLIKNMPADDPDRYGRIKDLLGMICNGIDAKAHQLNSDLLLQKKEAMIQAIQTSLNDIDQSFTHIQKKNITAIETMSTDIHESLLILGLMEYQEENIMKIAEKCLDDSNSAFFEGLSIKEDIEKIQHQLSLIIG